MADDVPWPGVFGNCTDVQLSCYGVPIYHWEFPSFPVSCNFHCPMSAGFVVSLLRLGYSSDFSDSKVCHCLWTLCAICCVGFNVLFTFQDVCTYFTVVRDIS